MTTPLDRFLELAGLGIRAQAVIALRTIRLAEGGPAALREAQRMVTEKVVATVEAEMAAARALLGGASFDDAASEALVPVRRCVEDNVRRLSGRLP
ncbi:MULTISPECIES: hypothetical protein [Rhodoplanes]|jgi:hypothetical protein|uniref:Uncharacterized protein n=1 Tax=Rhodoplanes serenus TaxID=200615 RepID=A0A327K134_9BRAD|nr:hypothetical protein [Rhodoplanes serenus]RAI32450.1 hypothetical protein CH340_15520 [Rhodoplanes serenus]VCU09757.1 hypothetical protein RHODGE_RHODGE_02927 [Rhodoplanes serenus]